MLKLLLMINLKPTFKNHHDSIARPAYLITFFFSSLLKTEERENHINKIYIILCDAVNVMK